MHYLMFSCDVTIQSRLSLVRSIDINKFLCFVSYTIFVNLSKVQILKFATLPFVHEPQTFIFSSYKTSDLFGIELYISLHARIASTRVTCSLLLCKLSR
jgi:hypothetical protein